MAPPAASGGVRCGNTTLDAEGAVDIFLAKRRHKKRDTLSATLAEKHGITSKAVRDVWKLRTWAWRTMPYWTAEDLDFFLTKHLCANCRKRGVSSWQSACSKCTAPKRRGRPTFLASVCAMSVAAHDDHGLFSRSSSGSSADHSGTASSTSSALSDEARTAVLAKHVVVKPESAPGHILRRERGKPAARPTKAARVPAQQGKRVAAGSSSSSNPPGTTTKTAVSMRSLGQKDKAALTAAEHRHDYKGKRPSPLRFARLNGRARESAQPSASVVPACGVGTTSPPSSSYDSCSSAAPAAPPSSVLPAAPAASAAAEQAAQAAAAGATVMAMAQRGLVLGHGELEDAYYPTHHGTTKAYCQGGCGPVVGTADMADRPPSHMIDGLLAGGAEGGHNEPLGAPCWRLDGEEAAGDAEDGYAYGCNGWWAPGLDPCDEMREAGLEDLAGSGFMLGFSPSPHILGLEQQERGGAITGDDLAHQLGW